MTPLQHLNEYIVEIKITDDMPIEIRARHVAVQAHCDVNQTRWNGEPYIVHPIRVAERLFGSAAKAVGYLHDVVEDTLLGLNDLRCFGFSEEIIKAVDSVTKRKGETYLSFILRSKANKIGREVKLADIQDNLSDLGTGHKPKRDKYELAFWILDS